MDEKALNELLECSVCLDRLDSQSKVLPCQHTFCRWCLEEIVSSKKELRCPECRYLVEVDVQDLPANILLIRLLEGMKNAARSSGSSAKSSPTKTLDRTGSGPSSPAHVQDSTQQSSYKCLDSTSLPCAKALYHYEASEPGDLSFKKSDIILLRKQVDENWYHGELNSKQGFFPATYVQVLNPMPNKENPSCKALYDFQSDCNERDCLTFHKDETLSIIRRVDDNWIEGKLGSQIGIFPSSFVELNDAAKLLVTFQASLAKNGSSLPNDLSGNGRCVRVPATSHTGASVPSSAHPRCTSSGTPCPAPEGAATTTSTGASTPHHASTNTSLGVAHRPHKRHSLTTLSPARSPPPHTHRHSMEVSAAVTLTFTTTAATNTSVSLVTSTAGAGVSSARNTTQVTAQEVGSRVALNIYTALYNYKPQKEDEMELAKGGCYSVTEKCQDGWYKGLCLRTGCRGVFPGNYVQIVKLSPTKLSGIGVSRTASSVSGSSSTAATKSCNVNSTQLQAAVAQCAKNSRTHVTRTHSFPKTSPLASMEYQVRLRNHGIQPSGSGAHPRPITNITQAQLRSHSHSVTSVAQSRSQSMLLSPADTLHVPGAGDPHQGVLSDTDDTLEEAENKSHSLPSASVACPARTSASLSSASTSSPRISRRHTHSDKCKSRGRVRSTHGATRHSLVPTASPHSTQATSTSIAPPPNVTVGAKGVSSQTESGPASPRDTDRDKEKKKDKERLPVSSFLLKKLSAGIPARIKKCKSPVPDNSRQAAGETSSATSAATSSPQHSQAKAAPLSVTTPVRMPSASLTTPAPHSRCGSTPSDNSQGAIGASGMSSCHKKSNSMDSYQGTPVNKPAKVKPLVRDRYRCIAPYPPQGDTELELKVNELVHVHRRRDDGWFKGTLLSSGKTGLFPGSFVERC